MKPARIYEQGKLYTLDDIRPITSQLKSVASRSTSMGLVHLYREKGNQNFWMGGPFQGPDSNFFIFLGPKETKEQTLKEIKGVLGMLAKNELGKFKEFYDQNDFDYDEAAMNSGFAALLTMDWDFDFSD